MSRAVRTPSRLDRDLAEPLPPLTLISGNKNFSSETLTAYELGYRTPLSPTVSGSISLYYNHYDDLRGLSLTPVTVLPLVYSNALKGKSYGFEVSGDVRLTEWWSLHAGYSLLRTQLEVKAGHTDFFNTLDETADPKHQLSLRSSLNLFRNLEADFLLRWIDTLMVNNGGKPGTVPSYTELNVRLAWRFGASTEFSIVGQNLLHARHAEFGPPTPSREEIQRGVYGKLAWRF